jgi:D-arginine dehydrogenase
VSAAIETEVAIVGAGIAGASVAAALAERCRVVLLEREAQAGYHSTGRSAALWSASLGDANVRALTIGSRPFFDMPPPGFAEHPLLVPRGVLEVAGEDARDALDAKVDACRVLSPGVTRLSPAEAAIKVPVLRTDGLVGAFWEPEAADMDVAALHQGFLRLARARGARVMLGAEVTGLARTGGTWILETPAGAVRADMVVNAAGAWADELARLAGAAPAGLVPCRRTGLIVPLPPGTAAAGWPLFGDIAERFYARPEAGRLMVSPADETPVPPCDIQPDELDVAIAVDQLEAATTLEVTRVERRWAGLRTFAPDRLPVVGFDAQAEGFFWLAGQGGYGIQTAPAMADLAAALLLDDRVPAALADLGLARAAIAPGRIPAPGPAS